ncbi:DUF6496 domain-containing protein [Ramlibacter tataouinensis]|uniref:DUF6496 domain-containing protein n=1 Tax=Ramlibacter tataouinensis TaxID=94132 RepID=UPI0022F3EB20|nr:DUF6496 domain-containing protein [Ramlibacter tataouinensis]WBY00411.1 DUF6496 domain-containing protein [Ramlibacter tataouinensis]
MARYGKKANEKVEEAMHEFKHGQLRSSSGDKVKNPKQAIAIGLSEARSEGGKVPKKKAGSDKPAAAKSSSGKSGGSKSGSKTTASRKSR